MFGLRANPEIEVLSDNNSAAYWDRSDRFDLALDLTAGRHGIAALGTVIVRWVKHLLDIDVIVEPLNELGIARWLGMSASMPAALGSATRFGMAPSSTRRTRSGRRAVPVDVSRHQYRHFDFVLSLLVLQHLTSTRAIENFLREFVRVLKPGGAIVVQLPLRAPTHRPPLPRWNTRAGFRLRTANALRRVGVPAHVLYERLDWVPEMTLLALPEETTRRIFEEAGATIVHVTPPSTDAGGTIDQIYFVTR